MEAEVQRPALAEFGRGHCRYVNDGKSSGKQLKELDVIGQDVKSQQLADAQAGIPSLPTWCLNLKC